MLLALAAVAMAAGGASRHPAGILLVALAFGAFQVASVVADVRLQERIAGPSRATVTSVASLLTDLSTIGVYALYAVAATSAGHGVAFALFAVPYLVVAAVLTVRRRPGRARGRSGGGERGGAGVAGQAAVDRRAARQ
jgi:hypothetical protein